MVTNLVFGHSFFDRQLLDRKIDVSQGRGYIEMMETSVLGVVNSDYVGLKDNINVEEAIETLVVNEVTEGYILSDDENGFIGKILLHDLIGQEKRKYAIEFIMKKPISIKSDASLQQAIEIASNFVGESIPVIDRESNSLKGVVTEGDLFKLYLNLQSKVADLEKS